MAGDWIKMRGNLWDDPRVSRLCDITGAAEGPVIGALYWLWATADQHTEDGEMPGLTLRQIDRKVGLPGFAAAMCEIGWLIDGAHGVVIVKFEEHNGTSAKRRCAEAQRKANGRKLSASDADTNQTGDGQAEDEIRQVAELEKEKRREEEIREKQEQEKTPKAPRKRRALAAGLQVVSLDQLVLEGVQSQHAADWLAVRGKKDLPLTPTAWEGVKAEAAKAGMSAGEAVHAAAANGWGGFKESWLREAPANSSRAAAPVNKQEALEQSNRQIAARWAAKLDQHDEAI